MTADSFVSIIITQLTDPFRIGLLAALLFTTVRNAPVTGWVVPLGAGLTFVAFIIATMFPKAGLTTLDATVSGLAANAIIMSILFVGYLVWQRFQK